MPACLGVPPATDIDRFTVILMTAGAAELEGDFERAERLAVEAIELAARLDDAHCLIWASVTAGRAGTQGDGLAYANRAVRVARERALVSTLPYALQAQAAQLFGLSRFDLVYAAAEEGRQLALDIGQPWIASLNVAYLSIVDALRGDEQLVHARNDEQQALVASSGPTRITRTRVRRGRSSWAGSPSEALERLLVPIERATAVEPVWSGRSGCGRGGDARAATRRGADESEVRELGRAFPHPGASLLAR